MTDRYIHVNKITNLRILYIYRYNDVYLARIEHDLNLLRIIS